MKIIWVNKMSRSAFRLILFCKKRKPAFYGVKCRQRVLLPALHRMTAGHGVAGFHRIARMTGFHGVAGIATFHRMARIAALHAVAGTAALHSLTCRAAFHCIAGMAAMHRGTCLATVTTGITLGRMHTRHAFHGHAAIHAFATAHSVIIVVVIIIHLPGSPP